MLSKPTRLQNSWIQSRPLAKAQVVLGCHSLICHWGWPLSWSMFHQYTGLFLFS